MGGDREKWDRARRKNGRKGKRGRAEVKGRWREGGREGKGVQLKQLNQYTYKIFAYFGITLENKF